MPWYNPRFKELTGQDPPSPRRGQAEAQAEPPQETGRRLVALDRSHRDKPDEQLRLNLDSFNGSPFLNLRVWTKDSRTGAWYPSKRGCSIRMSEAEDLISAIRAGVSIADREKIRTAGQGSAARRPQRQEPRPTAPEGAAEFDEFSN